jgi:glutamate 5-kinase
MRAKQRIVIKLGTGILTSGIGELDFEVIQNICSQVAKIREAGSEVIIVSSGAVGLGMGRLGMKQRPSDLASQQACASVGQSILIETWQRGFDPWGIHVGQMLLTREDLSVRKRHVSVKETLERLLKADIVPIINENDCISVDELKFGDNDVLSALVASLTKSELLVILSTIPGLMNLETGEVVSRVESLNEDIIDLAQDTKSPTAVGGMISKLNAVHVAVGSNCAVFIAPGKEPDILIDLLDGQEKGTYFVPQDTSIPSQKRWLAFFHQHAGTIVVDQGAREALEKSGKSLLAKGVKRIEGSFDKGSVIRVEDPEDRVIAKGISEFSSNELETILGKSNDEIRRLYPERKHPEVIHRDALVLIKW